MHVERFKVTAGKSPKDPATAISVADVRHKRFRTAIAARLRIRRELVGFSWKQEAAAFFKKSSAKKLFVWLGLWRRNEHGPELKSFLLLFVHQKKSSSSLRGRGALYATVRSGWGGG